MPNNSTQYKLLISCPGDVEKEIDIIKEVVFKFNETYSEYLGISIMPKHWSYSSYPESGDKPQNLLNKQLVDTCDAAVAIFWNRFGTPTDEYGSGTEEEICKMLEDNKQVFMYFSDVPASPNKIDSQQHQKVREFKEKYSQRGKYSIYNSTDEFKELFRENLIQHFLSETKTEEIEHTKKPTFKLEIIDQNSSLPIADKYSFCYPKGLLDRIERSEKDIDNNIAKYVTITDIQKYNEDLPSIEEVDSFNKQQSLYENVQNNCYSFQIELENTGEITANDIYVDLFFPDNMLAFYPDDIEDICEPKDYPTMPIDPVSAAWGKVYKLKDPISGSGIEKYNKQIEIIKRIEELKNDISNNDSCTGLNPINLDSKPYDYGIEDNSILSLHIDNLIHTRKYLSDEFSVIFTEQGNFKMIFEIMCKDFKEPIKGEYNIVVENKK